MRASEFFYKHAGVGSLLASVTNAVAIFLIFRLAYRELGPPAVGMWALIQGIMFISRVADGGSGGNITRLVAIDHAKQGAVRLRNFIFTGLLVGTGPLLLLGLLAAVPTFYYLKASYAHDFSLLPMLGLVICSVIFGAFISSAQILSGCLDGLGLMALRGYLASAANVLFPVIGYFFIYRVGVVGLGLTYVYYAIVFNVALLIGIGLFRPMAGPDYCQPSVRELSRKTLSFNVKFLLMTLSQLLLDPTCKLLISWIGGLDAVAIFDLTNKISTQARVLYQAGLRAVLPLLSRESTDIDQNIRARLLHWNRRVARWSLMTMSLIMLVSGYLSMILLGRVRQDFVLDILILLLGNSLNTLGLVGYYAEVGSGHLRRLVFIFLLAAVSNLTLSSTLGYVLGAIGVVTGFAMTLAWMGIAMARSVLGPPKQIALGLLPKILPELVVFGMAVAATWFVMVEISNASMILRSVVTGSVAMVWAAMFAAREWKRICAYGNRFMAGLANVALRASAGPRPPSS